MLALPVVLVLTGCGPEPTARADSSRDSSSSASGAGSGAGSASPSPTASVPGPVITTNVKRKLPIDEPLTVSGSEGTLGSVTVTGPYGELTGRLNAARTKWTSSGERAPNVTYHLTATATNAAGVISTLQRSFDSGAAARTLTADVSPYGDERVGVGQPIVVRLSASVSTSRRAAVEKALVVTADKPIGPASWYWWSSTELHYRPKEFWPARSSVKVAVNFAGVQGGTGLWGAKNRTVSFKIGRSLRDADHRQVAPDDRVGGRQARPDDPGLDGPGRVTRPDPGSRPSMSHEQTVRMTSESYGGKDFYDEIVHYAQRLTWSGEYLHSAPWSVGSQGRTNVSHGCVNIGPSNAIWLFNQTLIGDPVITTGTRQQMEPGNGTGGDWNISWARWMAGSALH